MLYLIYKITKLFEINNSSNSYPNIAQSADLDKGSKKVMIEGKPVCLESSTFSKSTGDEAGSLKGIISSAGQGEAKPLLFSPTVFIEGKAVVRNTDIHVSNKMNTPPAPVMQAQVAPAIAGAIKDVEVEIDCIHCGEPKNEECQMGKKKKKKKDKTTGDSGALTDAIVKNAGYGKIENHPWHFNRMQQRKGKLKPISSLQAHHLIVSASMNRFTIKDMCIENDYDINCHENGVMLPYYMDLACHLSVPLHRGPHSAGKSDMKYRNTYLNYPRAIEGLLAVLKRQVDQGKLCNAPVPKEEFIASMNDISIEILDKIKAWKWTISSDGKDYKQNSPTGCSNVDYIGDKNSNKQCKFRQSNEDQHNLKNSNGIQIKENQINTLKIGN